jgi:hypothetical protein
MILVSCNRPHESVPATTVMMDNVELAISLFQTDRDRLPISLQELLPATNGVMGGAASGYIKPTAITDSWGTPLRYRTGTNWYELRSAGRDATFDTKDDIVLTKGK